MYVAIIFNLILSLIIINIKSSYVPCKSDLFDVAWMSFLQMLYQPSQPSVVNTSPVFILQPINQFKGRAHHQFLTCLKLVSIIFEQFWMPCSNGGIALFILICHKLNNKFPFIWFWANSINMPHCHQSNVILFKLLWCCRFFLVVPHHPFHLFWNNLWSYCQYQLYSIQLQVCHKLLTLLAVWTGNIEPIGSDYCGWWIPVC